jgi:osmotically-inducible protein OsmY
MKRLGRLLVLILTAALGSPAVAAPPAKTTGVYTNDNSPGAAAQNALTNRVRARLTNDRLLSGAIITVETNASVVKLFGSVPTETAHAEALDLTRATAGVAAVTDDLRIDISSPDAPAPP